MATKKKKIILTVIAIFICVAAFAAYKFYEYFFASNVNISKIEYLYIPNNATFDEVLDSMRTKKILINESTFTQAAKYMKYSKIKGGRYKISSGMSNKQLVSMLRSGKQTPMRMTFSGNIRSNEKIASIASRYIAADSVEILNTLNNSQFLSKFNFSPSNVIGMFIPNTYEIYWNTSAEDFVERMNKEFVKFWNAERMAKLKAINLTQNQAITLASIVNEETAATAEMPTIAGVYINRLHANMLLQADPTLKYAVGDFSIRRVLDSHKKYDSPYNTYMYQGLPPGAICMPSIAAIDAVLNYQKHDYYYFCAKDDFSGVHIFSKTLAQHNINSQAYHRALNRLNIK